MRFAKIPLRPFSLHEVFLHNIDTFAWLHVNCTRFVVELLLEERSAHIQKSANFTFKEFALEAVCTRLSLHEIPWGCTRFPLWGSSKVWGKWKGLHEVCTRSAQGLHEVCRAARGLHEVCFKVCNFFAEVKILPGLNFNHEVEIKEHRFAWGEVLS